MTKTEIERLEWLHVQYVLSLQNDGTWYKKAGDAIMARNFGQFRRVTCDAANKVRLTVETGKMFNDLDRTYIVLTLWFDRGGPVLQQDSDFTYYMERARHIGLLQHCVREWAQAVGNHFGNPKQDWTVVFARWLPDHAVENPSAEDRASQAERELREHLQSAKEVAVSAEKLMRSFHSQQPETQPEEEPIMSAKFYETKQYINGREVGTYSDDELIGLIKSTEDKIKGLKQIETKSKKVEANIAELQANLTSIVQVLDARA